MKRNGKQVVIYHVVRENEGYESSAKILFQLVHNAKQTQAGKRRVIYLDIEGHRNPAGGWDADMFVLQKDFLIGYLLRFVSEISCPLMKKLRNPGEQSDDIPNFLRFQ